MKLEANITKKRFFALFGAVLLLAGVGLVYASSHPGYVGHSADQIDFSAGVAGSTILDELFVSSSRTFGGYGAPDGAVGRITFGSHVNDAAIIRSEIDGPNAITGLVFEIRDDPNDYIEFRSHLAGSPSSSSLMRVSGGGAVVMEGGSLRINHPSGAFIQWQAQETSAHAYSGWGEWVCNAPTDTCNSENSPYTCGSLEKRVCADTDRGGDGHIDCGYSRRFRSRTVTCRTQVIFQPSSGPSPYLTS